MSRLQMAAPAWVAFSLAMVLLNSWVPQPFGPAALTAIFEPYLVMSGLAAAALSLRTPGWPTRTLVVALLVLTLPLYGPAWTSLSPQPAAAGQEALRVSTLNILAGEGALARTLEAIAGANADLIGLQELEPEVSAALTGTATGFAFQAMAADPGISDVGLLSRHPILESQALADLPALRVVVDPPSSEPIVVYVAHPPLARLVRMGDVPYGVDLSARDVTIARIRERVDEDLLAGRSVILMGDFNTTEREAAYAWLSAGLQDAHLDAGAGPGLTWRPSPLSFVPVGMLRIDYVLSTPDLVATSSSVDCSVRSDHCRVDADLVMTSPNSAAPGRVSYSGAGSPPPRR